MNTLYNLALRQSSSIQSELALVESTPASSSSFTSLSGQLSASLAALGRTVDDYENMAKRELNVPKREKALQRVKKFRDEERDFRSSFQSIKARGVSIACADSGLSKTLTEYYSFSSSQRHHLAREGAHLLGLRLARAAAPSPRERAHLTCSRPIRSMREHRRRKQEHRGGSGHLPSMGHKEAFPNSNIRRTRTARCRRKIDPTRSMLTA